MDKYLALIRKADFIDLFKYGYFHVNRDLSIPVIGDIEYLRSHKTYLNKFADHANCFESSFEYLFLLYKGNQKCHPMDILIENVLAIIPLDNEAKREFSISFDPRIRIEEPLWPSASVDFQKIKDFESHKRGAENLWKIWDIKDNISDYQNIITDDIVREVIGLFNDNRRPTGDLSLWVYLMLYERHAFYPKNTVGAFMDTVNVFCNFLEKKEVDSTMVETTKIYHFLNAISSSDKKFNNIIKQLNNNKETEPFMKKIKEEAFKKEDESKEEKGPDIDFVKVSALYFILKQRYSNGLYQDNETIEICKKVWGREFNLAAYILGIILGYDNTYDLLYDKLPLAIFHKEPKKVENANGIQEHPTKIKDVVEQSDSLNVDKSSDAEGRNIEESNIFNTTNTLQFPCTMRKYTKSGKPSLRKGKPVLRLVKDLQEYRKLSKENWHIENK